MRALPDRITRQDIRQVRCNGATAQGAAAVTLGVGAHENGGGSHELRAGHLNQLLRVIQGQYKELLGGAHAERVELLLPRGALRVEHPVGRGAGCIRRAVQYAPLPARLADQQELQPRLGDCLAQRLRKLLTEGGTVKNIAAPLAHVLECQPGGGASGGAAERLVVVEGAGVFGDLGGAGARGELIGVRGAQVLQLGGVGGARLGGCGGAGFSHSSSILRLQTVGALKYPKIAYKPKRQPYEGDF